MKLMEKSKKGIGLLGLVFVLFLTLKLAGVGAVAAWSWWWVTAPLWAPAGLSVLLLACLVIYYVFEGRK